MRTSFRPRRGRRQPFVPRRRTGAVRAAHVIELAGVALLTLAFTYWGLRLRAGILWELRDWPGAAVALSRLVPQKPPAGRAHDEVEDQTVLDLAVAYSLAGDRKALRDLKRRYGPAMAAGSRAESFALLTSDFRKAEITKVAEELAGVERIQAFMAGYRALSREAKPGTAN